MVLERWVGVVVIGPAQRRTGRLGWRARAGRYDSTHVAPDAGARPADPRTDGGCQGVPTDPTASTPGRSLVSRRALTDIVRAATLGSYGVTGLAGGALIARLAHWAGFPPPGIDIALGAELTIDLDLTVAPGLPIAEVARQVDAAIRHEIRRALGREVDRLTIHVGGLRMAPFQGDERAAADRPAPDLIGPDDLAASGTDVA